MKLVYIASRVRGDVKHNLELTNAYCLYAITENVVPVVPHLMLCGALDDNDPEQRKTGLKIGKALLAKCDAAWIFIDERGISEGMQSEVNLALELGIPVIPMHVEQIFKDTED